MSVEVYVDVRARLGEGPRWDAVRNELLWVDIDRGEVRRGDEVTSFGERVGAAAPTDDGGLLVATATGLVLDGVRLAEFPHGADTRANDGACDSTGRFWIGTTALDFHDGGGTLYRFDGALAPVLERVGLSNGLGWSPDGTRFYYIDSNTQRVDLFDYEDGEISNRRPFASIAPDDGTPDGLAIDDEGGVWVALYGGSRVRRYDDGGALVHELAIPGENVTACCFGGSSLYVTTAAPDGRVYVADVGVTGPPAQPFRRTAPSDADPTSAR